MSGLPPIKEPEESAITGRAVAKIGTGTKIAGIIPTSVEEVFRLGELIHQSGLAPDSLKTPQAVTVVLMKGLEIGLPPMVSLETIGVINGKACLYGDAIPALLWAAGFDIDERYENENDLPKLIAHCAITRPNGKKYSSTYSAQDALQSKLWTPGATDHKEQGKPWNRYTKRMTRMRCRIWLARDVASDVLRGMPIYEEQRDIELDRTEYSETPQSQIKPPPAPRRTAPQAEVVAPPDEEVDAIIDTQIEQEDAAMRAAGLY